MPRSLVVLNVGIVESESEPGSLSVRLWDAKRKRPAPPGLFKPALRDAGFRAGERAVLVRGEDFDRLVRGE